MFFLEAYIQMMFHPINNSWLELVIDRYWVFITDTDNDYLHVYVPDNRYSEPIFIYCYKVNK